MLQVRFQKQVSLRRFVGNTAHISGGAIAINGSSTSSISLDSCQFASNSAGECFQSLRCMLRSCFNT